MKVFEYYGSKTNLAPDLLKLIAPLKHRLTCIVDVFGGSGAFILNVPVEYNVQRVYNDLDRWLYTTFQVVHDDAKRAKLLELLELSYRNRAIWEEYKKKYHEDEMPESDIEVAFRIIYLYQYGFNGSLTSWGINRNDANREGDKMGASIEGIKGLATALRHKFSAENLDFRKLMKKWDSPTTLFYLDPPYLTGRQHYRKGRKGGFGEEDFKDLKAICDKLQGYYIMNESDKDEKEINAIFGEPQMRKKYANQIARNFAGITTSYRVELFYHNLDKPQPQPTPELPVAQHPLASENAETGQSISI